jgi:hypothetical protein
MEDCPAFTSGKSGKSGGKSKEGNQGNQEIQEIRRNQEKSGEIRGHDTYSQEF